MAATAFLVGLLLTPIVRDIFRTYEIVDRPDGRKVHKHPIPRIGGIPIAIACVYTLYHYGSVNAPLMEVLAKLGPGVTVVFLTGLFDDFLNLRPLVKLAGQILGSCLVFFMGLRIESVAGFDVPLLVSFPLTLLWLLLCTNALNLIDGLDGLCAGTGLLASLILLLAGYMHGIVPLTLVTAPLVGALIAFLCYNFNPATVFLGDSGALTIGFLLGCYGMIWTQKSTTILSFLVPLLALSIPLLDLSLAVVRRFLRNQPIFGADRDHIHHRLLDRGLTPRRAVFFLHIFTLLVGGLALLMLTSTGGRHYNIVLLVVLGIAWVGIRELRYAEFDMAGRFLFGGQLQRNLQGRLRLEQLRASLTRCSSEDAWWETIRKFALDCGWVAVWWEKGGVVLRRQQWAEASRRQWEFRVLLGEEESLWVAGPPESLLTVDLMAFAATVQEMAEHRKGEAKVAALERHSVQQAH
jgi:UDP-GlcNAc:undecaprenyl-phosphate GlcNAc-1-phosphate transferase